MKSLALVQLRKEVFNRNIYTQVCVFVCVWPCWTAYCLISIHAFSIICKLISLCLASCFHLYLRCIIMGQASPHPCHVLLQLNTVSPDWWRPLSSKHEVFLTQVDVTLFIQYKSCVHFLISQYKTFYNGLAWCHRLLIPAPEK